MAQLEGVSFILYDWNAKKRSKLEMTLESEKVNITLLKNKLKDLELRLNFSPFLAGTKLTFADVLMSTLLKNLKDQFPTLVDAEIKNLNNVNRILNYSSTFSS